MPYASRYPSQPWQVSLYTSACDRVVLLEQVLEDAVVKSQVLGSVADALCQRAWAQVNSRTGSRRAQDVPAAFAAQALRWAQERGYHPDPAGEEWFQPVEWTIAHGGDCEDLASLIVALCRAVSIPSRLVWIDQPGAPLNHVTAQIEIRTPVYGLDPTQPIAFKPEWVWADASMLGADLGENPYHAAARLRRHDVLGGGGQ